MRNRVNRRTGGLAGGNLQLADQGRKADQLMMPFHLIPILPYNNISLKQIKSKYLVIINTNVKKKVKIKLGFTQTTF
jgi:hypothetical protein